METLWFILFAEHMQESLSDSDVPVHTWMLDTYSGNKQIQLWQFLLELLSNNDYSHVISWEGVFGEFVMKVTQFLFAFV